ncbi:MAG: M67 family metallopeptidase [Methylococcales bacterium]|nr:M67 family metallopeptidase [Methylococcales bacterium]MDD5753306.1 M67 family metallopeptidase [Methylococcales bacterium]
MTTEIQLSRKLTSQLLHLAQISPDAEVCGLVSAKNNVPIQCYPIENVAEQPQTHFTLNPKQQITAMKQMRENGEELFAIYHSHPSAPACPSTLDLESATYPDALHFIISLNTKGILELRAFHITNQSATEVRIVLSHT